MNDAEGEKIPEVLEVFLDAGSPQAKLDVIARHREEIDEHILSNMEASLDLFGGEGSLDDRMDRIEYYLRTRSRFETSRLR